MADLIIRGGTVIDGTATPGRVADVAITDGTITAVGTLDEPSIVGTAAREIDADGLLVTPGFVDIHTHFDGQVTWDPIVAPSSLHGVTTIAMGNCGVGFAPAAPDRHAWLISLLEGVEDIPGTALAEGLTWDWETFPEYLDSLDAKPHTVDIGAHVPHAAVRTYVMGDRGADHAEVPTEAEISAMAQTVEAALDAGAIGFATSRTEVHRTSGGQNIGTLTASDAELLAIADAMRRSIATFVPAGLSVAASSMIRLSRTPRFCTTSAAPLRTKRSRPMRLTGEAENKRRKAWSSSATRSASA